MPVFFGGRELREVSTREAGRRYRVNGRRRYGHGGVATFSEDIFRSARRIFLTPAQMQKRLKKRYDARTPQSVSHRAYARERKRYASTLVLSPHAIVPNCSYLLASSVGIRRVPSRRRSSSNKVAENKKSHVPWRHVRQQRMHRDRRLCSPPGVSDDCSCLPRTQRKKRYIRSKDFVACACANLNSAFCGGGVSSKSVMTAT